MVRGLLHVSITHAVEGLIHVIRGQKVILDADLAALYGVEVWPRHWSTRAVRRRGGLLGLMLVVTDLPIRTCPSKAFITSRGTRIRGQRRFTIVGGVPVPLSSDFIIATSVRLLDRVPELLPVASQWSALAI